MKMVPNLITIFRLLLVWPIGYFLLTKHYGHAFILFVIASISDLLDGIIARRVGITRLGTILDPLADKSLMTMGFVCLALLKVLPFWLMWTVVLRDIYLVCGACLYHYLRGPYHFTPTWFSKCNTALQLGLLVIALFDLAYPYGITNGIIHYLGYFVVLSALGTAFQYTYLSFARGWRPLIENN